MLKNSLFALTSLILAASCSPKIAMAPTGSVPIRTKLPQFTKGGWVNINNGIQGELIAVDDHEVWFLPENSSIQSIPRQDINSAVVVVHRSSNGHYAIWSTVGGISTISNGFFLIFTFPMWVGTGIGTVTAESRRDNYVHYPGYSWEDIGEYARFPQGIPESLPLESIQ